jgi:hypothetical protein
MFPIRKYKTKHIHQKKNSGFADDSMKKNKALNNFHLNVRGNQKFGDPMSNGMFFLNMNK